IRVGVELDELVWDDLLDRERSGAHRGLVLEVALVDLVERHPLEQMLRQDHAWCVDHRAQKEDVRLVELEDDREVIRSADTWEGGGATARGGIGRLAGLLACLLGGG